MAPAPLALAYALTRPQLPNPADPPPSPIPGVPTSDPPTTGTGTISQNIPILALSLAFAAFLLVCLSICCCSYRRAKRRHPQGPRAGVAFSAAREQDQEDLGWGGFGGEGLGLGIRKERDVGEREELPKYEEPQAGTLKSGRARPKVPSLIISPSPGLSPSGDDDEDRRLLSAGFTPRPTPPPPAYTGPPL